MDHINHPRSKNWLPNLIDQDTSDRNDAIVSRISKEISWSIYDAMSIAILLLQDVNAHKECEAVNFLLVDAMNEMDKEMDDQEKHFLAMQKLTLM